MKYMPKYLGQHFLIDKNKLQEIVEALDLKPNEVVIEIGPGHGELTTNIKNQSASRQTNTKIIAIEKDHKFTQNLQNKFIQDKNIEIIEGDALRLLPQLTNNLRLTTNNYKIVGNIPYYITGYLLRILGELENKPSLIVLTVQKEVAERICASPPTKNLVGGKPPKMTHSTGSGSSRVSRGMNLLAASVQFWAKPEIIGFIPKKYFRPIPKVDGAIIKLMPKPQKIPAKAYYSFIKVLFKQPRKTILNNLAASIKYKVLSIKNKEEIIEKLKKSNINPQDRPQNLAIEQLLKLSTLF